RRRAPSVPTRRSSDLPHHRSGWYMVALGQNQIVQIDFQCVVLIAGGLLEVHAIRLHLPFYLLLQNVLPQSLPTRCFPPMREQGRSEEHTSELQSRENL